ncbi:MAG: hypothetical protein AAFR16_14290 [Pseudomonadota bacterium]
MSGEVNGEVSLASGWLAKARPKHATKQAAIVDDDRDDHAVLGRPVGNCADPAVVFGVGSRT